MKMLIGYILMEMELLPVLNEMTIIIYVYLMEMMKMLLRNFMKNLDWEENYGGLIICL